MKKQIIFISGGEAKENYKDFMDYLEKLEFNPYEEKLKKWHEFLQEDLGKDFEVINIPMPNKKFADYLERKKMFEKIFIYLKKDAIFIGYSLGGTFLAKYFDEEKIDFSFSKLFLVAPAFKDCDREVLGTFNFNKSLENLKKYMNKISIFYSKDDFIVPFSDFLDFKNVLPKTNFFEFEDKNHFLDRDFSELLEELRKVGKSFS